MHVAKFTRQQDYSGNMTTGYRYTGRLDSGITSKARFKNMDNVGHEMGDRRFYPEVIYKYDKVHNKLVSVNKIGYNNV